MGLLLLGKNLGFVTLMALVVSVCLATTGAPTLVAANTGVTEIIAAMPRNRIVFFMVLKLQVGCWVMLGSGLLQQLERCSEFGVGCGIFLRLAKVLTGLVVLRDKLEVGG
jgi:hypothetical protein